MTRTVIACPDCDSTTLTKQGSSGVDAGPGPAWRCDDCGATFSEHERRAPVDDRGQSRAGLAGALCEADASEVFDG